MKPSRRTFLTATGAVVAAGIAQIPLTAAFEPLETSIRELQRAMGAGQLTSAQLVQFYMDRIAGFDAVVNAMLFLNTNAPAGARALDAERRRGKVRGPLHGIPILL